MKIQVLHGNIRFVYDSSMTTNGSGRIVLRAHDGREVIVDDVLYVPGLKTNLLSVGQLLQKGFTMTMENNFLNDFYQNNKVVNHANLSYNSTFHVEMDTLKQ